VCLPDLLSSVNRYIDRGCKISVLQLKFWQLSNKVLVPKVDSFFFLSSFFTLQNSGKLLCFLPGQITESAQNIEIKGPFLD
jgi:hypothetical protein